MKFPLSENPGVQTKLGFGKALIGLLAISMENLKAKNSNNPAVLLSIEKKEKMILQMEEELSSLENGGGMEVEEEEGNDFFLCNNFTFF